MAEYSAFFDLNTSPVGGPPVGGPPVGGPPVGGPPATDSVQMMNVPTLPKFILYQINNQFFWMVEGVNGKAWNGRTWINL